MTIFSELGEEAKAWYGQATGDITARSVLPVAPNPRVTMTHTGAKISAAQ
jgi:hypothetical protein